jgi:hypothetical protein
MSTHTPGPWYRNIKPATKYNTVWAGRNTHVAHVTVDGLSPDEVEANIALIAKAPIAPKLAEALRDCLDYCVDSAQFTPENVVAFIEAADAALAEWDNAK